MDLHAGHDPFRCIFQFLVKGERIPQLFLVKGEVCCKHSRGGEVRMHLAQVQYQCISSAMYVNTSL